jgi:hypothetical protein
MRIHGLLASRSSAKSSNASYDAGTTSRNVISFSTLMRAFGPCHAKEQGGIDLRAAQGIDQPSRAAHLQVDLQARMARHHFREHVLMLWLLAPTLVYHAPVLP